MAVDYYYFNASDSGPTDPNGVWTDDANAFDGSTATAASCTTVGSTSSNYLFGGGTTAPTSGNTISQVRARIYTSFTSGGNAAIYTSGLAELLGTPTATTGFTADWGAYTTLSTPSGGWTWQKVNDLEVKLYTTGGSFFAYVVQLEVTSSAGDGTISTADSITVTDSPSYYSDLIAIRESYSVSITGGAATLSVNVSDSVTVSESVSLSQNSPVMYYFDGSDGTSDPNGVWTDIANVFDNDISTFGYTTTIGTTSSNYLLGEGTNAPTSGGNITQVRARFKATGYLSAATGGITIYTNGLAEVVGSQTALLDATAPNGGFSNFFLLTTPSGGWTWQKLNDLEVKIYYVSDNALLAVYIVQLEVLSDAEINISVSDNVSVSESISVLIPTLLINKSDSIAVSESITVLSTSNIAVSDSVTISEANNQLLVSNIASSDNVALSETINRLLTSLTNTSDSITVTESSIAELNSFINKSDSISVTDIPNVTIPISGNLSINVSDTITITESIPTPTVSYKVGNSGISRYAWQDAQNTATATSVSATYPYPTTAGNLLIATVSRRGSSTITISGFTGTTIGVNSSTAQVGIFYKIADGSETSISTDVLTSALTEIHIYEYTGNTNPLTLDVAFTTNGNSTSNFTSFATASISTSYTDDLIFAVVGLNGTSTNGSFTSGVNTRQVTSSLIDGDLSPDALVSSFSGTASWTNSLKASGIIGAFRAKKSSASDSITATESVNVTIPTSGVLSVNVSDNITVSENLKIETNNYITTSDSVSVSENVKAEINSVLSASDNITISESVKAEANNNINKSDTITVTENVNVTIQAQSALAISVSDSITVSESVNLLIPTLFISTSDSMTVAENVFVNTGQTTTRLLTLLGVGT